MHESCPWKGVVSAGLTPSCNENSSACFTLGSGSRRKTGLISIIHHNVCLILPAGEGDDSLLQLSVRTCVMLGPSGTKKCTFCP